MKFFSTLILVVLLFSSNLFAQEAGIFDVTGRPVRMSQDGNLVISWLGPDAGCNLWSENGGEIFLGNGDAWAVTNEGVVVGSFFNPDFTVDGQPVRTAGLWQDGVWTWFGEIPGVPATDPMNYTEGLALSATGEAACGMAWMSSWEVQAYIWTASTGIVLLPDMGSGSKAMAISDDGLTVGGWIQTEMGSWLPAVWNISETTTYQIMDMTGYGEDGQVCAMNNSGTIYVGSLDWFGMMWNETEKIQVTEMGYNDAALDISEDTTVVGGSGLASEAFIWNQEFGYKVLKDYCTELGIDVSAYENFGNATCISDDANCVAGWNFFGGFFIRFKDVTVPNNLENEIVTENINIYPNPANDIIHITSDFNSEIVNIELFDITGKSILVSNNSISKNSTEISINLPQNLEAGIYQIRLTTSKNSVTKKIIIN